MRPKAVFTRAVIWRETWQALIRIVHLSVIKVSVDGQTVVKQWSNIFDFSLAGQTHNQAIYTRDK